MPEDTRDSNESSKFSPEEAAAILSSDRQKRADLASKELQSVLERFDCELMPIVSIVGSQITTTIRLVAK